MKKFNFLWITLQFLFVSSSLAFFHNLVYSQVQKESYREELSYGEKDHYFLKKWGKGLSEVVQSRQQQPWRKATWEERIKYFVSQLRKGDQEVFLYVSYALLDGYGSPYTHRSVSGYPTSARSIESNGVIRILNEDAIRKGISLREVLTLGNEETRKNVIKATLSGLFNKDPRVRLIAINLLRRLGPDYMMFNHVKRAMALETVTTVNSKLRPKDIDIPTIESPRLGYIAKAWQESLGEKPYDITERYRGYHPEKGKGFFLDGNSKGDYLTHGLYKKNEKNFYKIDFYRQNHLTGEYKINQIWTKAPLLRYGADTKESGFEEEYGFKKREVMPRFVYLYSDYQDPDTNEKVSSIYYAYHSVWEELNKLYLFINRALWLDKIDKGDINVLAKLSKDSFRSLADQIDGESLENVPFKSSSFKTLNEDHVHAVILGMLNNKVVSSREECLRFLKRLYASKSLDSKTKQEIKLAIHEARRRELILDTVRGRHLQAELLVFHETDSKKLDTATIINEEVKDVLDVNAVLDIDNSGNVNVDLNDQDKS